MSSLAGRILLLLCKHLTATIAIRRVGKGFRLPELWELSKGFLCCTEEDDFPVVVEE